MLHYHYCCIQKNKRGVDADFESFAIKYITFVSDMVQYPSARMIYLDHTALYFLIDAVFFNRLKIFFIMFFKKNGRRIKLNMFFHFVSSFFFFFTCYCLACLISSYKFDSITHFLFLIFDSFFFFHSLHGRSTMDTNGR